MAIVAASEHVDHQGLEKHPVSMIGAIGADLKLTQWLEE